MQQTVTKTIAETTKLGNSRNGNPAYRVTCTDGTVLETAPDSMVAYSLPNPEHRNRPVVLTLDNGRIIGID